MSRSSEFEYGSCANLQTNLKIALQFSIEDFRDSFTIRKNGSPYQCHLSKNSNNPEVTITFTNHAAIAQLTEEARMKIIARL